MAYSLTIERDAQATMPLYDVVLYGDTGTVKLHSFADLPAAEAYVSDVAAALDRTGKLT